MITMDVFKGDAFSAISMTEAIQKVPTVPNFLGSLGLFTPTPIRTTIAVVEQRSLGNLLIRTTERGSPAPQDDRDRRQVRNFNTPRIRKESTLYAHELQGIRAFGSETELMAVQTEMAFRQRGLLDELDLTMEYHRLGALQGILLDADGTSVLYNYFTEFGITQPSEIAFNNTAITNAGGFRAFIAQVITRPLMRALGMAGNSAQVMVLCGDAFYDYIRDHADVRATYLNTAEARDLRAPTAFETFVFAGVTWVNYRGTDDNTTVAIAANKARIFVRGVPGLFQVAYSPHEAFGFVNTLGLPRYARTIMDKDRDEWAKVEVSSYPLHICTRPEALLRGTL